jgi:hypothetical protein
LGEIGPLEMRNCAFSRSIPTQKAMRPARRRIGKNAILIYVFILLLMVTVGPAFAHKSVTLPTVFFYRQGRVLTLPGDRFVPGWKKSEPPRTFTGQDLFNHIDGGAELFLEFGFVKLLVQAYGDGKSELTAGVYEMDGPASALGIYLMKMGKETPFAGIGARNSSEDAQLTILKGRYFVQIDNLGDTPAPRATAITLARALLAGISEEKAPTPLDQLPAEGRIPGSERLIRGPYGLQPYFTFGEGDILALGGRIFGALADYRTADGIKFTRLIVPYPEPDAAAAVMAHLRANLDPFLKITASRPDGFDFVDFQAKKGIVTRKSDVLEIRFKIS